MKKIISFVLYGDDEKYTNGILCNLELGKIIYPDWIIRVYCDENLNNDLLTKIKSYDNSEVVLFSRDVKINKMSIRFLAYDDPSVDIMLSRDADSRLSFKEKILVDYFIKSDKCFHSIRDHVLHDTIMGGMFGIKKNCIDVTIYDLLNHNDYHSNNYGIDQWFLKQEIQPLVVNKTLSHHSNYDSTYNTEQKNYDIDEIVFLNEKIKGVHKNYRHFIGEIFPGDNYGKPFNHVFL